jgi:hypothetical protein
MVSAQHKTVRAGSHDSRWYSADTICDESVDFDVSFGEFVVYEDSGLS